MNAAVMEPETTPEIKTLNRKVEQAKAKFPFFQETADRAQAKHSKAKEKHSLNLDPERANDCLVELRLAESAVEAAVEPLRVCRKSIETLETQISAATAVFHEREADRLIEEYRLQNAESDKELQAVLRKKQAQRDKFLPAINHHRPSYPGIVAYGPPSFYVGDGLDLLEWRVGVSVEVGPTQTTLRMVKT